jgi:hypothetical protein
MIFIAQNWLELYRISLYKVAFRWPLITFVAVLDTSWCKEVGSVVNREGLDETWLKHGLGLPWMISYSRSTDSWYEATSWTFGQQQQCISKVKNLSSLDFVKTKQIYPDRAENQVVLCCRAYQHRP